LGRGPQWSAERTVREMIGDAYDRVDVLNLGHPEYVRAAAVAGLGFAALSKRAVASEIHTGLLKRLPLKPFLRSITAVRRQGRSGAGSASASVTSARRVAPTARSQAAQSWSSRAASTACRPPGLKSARSS